MHCAALLFMVDISFQRGLDMEKSLICFLTALSSTMYRQVYPRGLWTSQRLLQIKEPRNILIPQFCYPNTSDCDCSSVNLSKYYILFHIVSNLERHVNIFNLDIMEATCSFVIILILARVDCC